MILAHKKRGTFTQLTIIGRTAVNFWEAKLQKAQVGFADICVTRKLLP
jgi:hypothetical protein